MKYSSLTTPGVEHDEANLLTEFIWLNKDIRCDSYPWSGQSGKQWGKIVAAVKKLMTDSYGLTAQQIAFYVWKCKPRFINPQEFAKMAVVARKLFEHYELDQVARLYEDWRKELSSSGLEKAKYKEQKPKNLLTFLRELERGER